MSDIGWLDDLDPYFRLVDSRTALLQSIARRLQCVQGSLSGIGGDPAYGCDLRLLQGARLVPSRRAAITAAIHAQCMQDARVRRASVSVDDSSPERIRIGVTVTDDLRQTLSLQMYITARGVEVVL